ncbi:MAG: CBS domain-containing protein [Novosphingobium sp.]
MTIARVIANQPAHDVVTCDAAITLREAVALLSERRIGALPVHDGERIVGIFSERDVIYCIARDGAAALDHPVSAVMTAPAVTVSPDTSVLSALSLMTKRRIRHLPVTQDGQTVGFISIGDLVKYRIDHIEAEAEALRSYIQTA